MRLARIAYFRDIYGHTDIAPELDFHTECYRTEKTVDYGGNNIIPNDHHTFMKGVPLGNDCFGDIRDDDSYYVDKSGLIEEIVSQKGTQVYLFTRPRRFGKSLNLSMIDSFFNIEYAGNGWFEGLRVMSSEKCVEMMNKYPVISITLKGLSTGSYEDFISDFREIIREVCRRSEYLLEMESAVGMSIEELVYGNSSEAVLKRSLRTLSEALTKYHGSKTIILIDEYDDAINSSYGKDPCGKITSFMRSLLSNALKSNPNLRFGVVTGVMQIAKESIFSGLNNLYVNTIFDKDCNEAFGFTESEVRDMLTYYGQPEKLDEVREWYDGYRFGDADIYNPWSILNYIRRNFRIDSYWLNEGDPAIILESVGMVGCDALDVITELYNEGNIDAALNKNMIFTDLSTLNGLLSLLTGSGYLKAVPGEGNLWNLSLVNKEVRSGLLDQLVNGRWTPIYMNKLSRAILDGCPEEVEMEFSNCLDTSMDSKLTRNERYYQAFALGLLNCLKDRYYVRSEYNGGKGYADIAIIPRDGKGPSAVIELKDEDKNSDDKRMRDIADSAIDQIFKLRYFADLHGDIQLYGMATRQTDAFVSYRKIRR